MTTYINRLKDQLVECWEADAGANTLVGRKTGLNFGTDPDANYATGDVGTGDYTTYGYFGLGAIVIPASTPVTISTTTSALLAGLGQTSDFTIAIAFFWDEIIATTSSPFKVVINETGLDGIEIQPIATITDTKFGMQAKMPLSDGSYSPFFSETANRDLEFDVDFTTGGQPHLALIEWDHIAQTLSCRAMPSSYGYADPGVTDKHIISIGKTAGTADSSATISLVIDGSMTTGRIGISTISLWRKKLDLFDQYSLFVCFEPVDLEGSPSDYSYYDNNMSILIRTSITDLSDAVIGGTTSIDGSGIHIPQYGVVLYDSGPVSFVNHGYIRIDTTFAALGMPSGKRPQAFAIAYDARIPSTSLPNDGTKLCTNFYLNAEIVKSSTLDIIGGAGTSSSGDAFVTTFGSLFRSKLEFEDFMPFARQAPIWVIEGGGIDLADYSPTLPISIIIYAQVNTYDPDNPPDNTLDILSNIELMFGLVDLPPPDYDPCIDSQGDATDCEPIMPFHDVRFPVDYMEGTSGGPMYSNRVTINDSGSEQRAQLWNNGRVQYELGYVANPANMNEIIAFFRARKGRIFSFRFKDWSDYTAVGEELVNPGSGSTLQLIKTYTDGVNPEVKKITKPCDNSTLILYDNSTPVVSPTVDFLTGIVTVPGGIIAGHTYTWDGQFDVPVRFDVDKLTFIQETVARRSLSSLPVIEVLGE